MKTYVLSHTKSTKTSQPHDFKHLWKRLAKHTRRYRKEADTPVNETERNLVNMTYEEFSSVFFFEAAVLLGKAGVPESSVTAKKIYAEAPWDMIIWTARSEGFLTLARHLEARFRTWLSLPVESAGIRSCQ